ncbi:sensor histidine kinase [Spongiimicrobium salis]|uniref:sensor histidine kinase n=1 Tax=Spongiimicrobium salis TaxID=1667022 RepID=UPI00374CEAC7
MTNITPKIPQYWRIGIAAIIAILLYTIIWVVSKFKESPGIDLIFSLLLLLMAYLTLETVNRFQRKLYNAGFFNKNILQHSLVLVGSILAGTLCYSVLFYGFKWGDHFYNGSEVPMLSHMVTAALMGFSMSIIFAFIQFALYWKHQYYTSYIENEQIKKEIANANLSLLRNQLDPHFMFNNFNTLYYLIDDNPHNAKSFLKNMASVHRYILQNNEKVLIPVRQEYDMAKQYLEVIQQRYGDDLRVTDTIRGQIFEKKCVPPLVLQQLIENAIKHNRIDTSFPLDIAFSANEHQLTISNNNNPKRMEPTSQTGLKNIKKRYRFVTDKKVVIANDKASFSVSIPLISCSP